MSFARSWLLPAACALGVIAALPVGCGDDTNGPGTGGGGNTTTTTTSMTTTSSTGGGMVCTPGTTQPCYTGPAGTENVGICKGGMATCAADGSGFGACTGEVLPMMEDCATPADDDCDGAANQAGAGCVCEPFTTASCYEGPASTENVGLCQSGTKTCAADGKSYGACAGQVLPAAAEDCTTPGDDDCNGMTNETCKCTPGDTHACYSGPPATKDVGPCKGGMQECNAQGTGFGPCMGEVAPKPETCNTPEDDNCNGQTNEGGAGCVCPPKQMVACYTGPAGTAGKGICKAGLALCNDQGTAMGACNGEVLPKTETCNTSEDDNCNGQTNEGGAGCVCLPGSVAACYTGPASTQGVGICKAGTKACNAQGTAYGACMGEVLPAASETCGNTTDDDCDGQLDEGCPAVTYAADVQPILTAYCAPCHTPGIHGGLNVGNYATTQIVSTLCAGKTKGACSLVLIQNGSMPDGGGCTGSPALDAAKPWCLTAAQQATIQAWIDGGQLP